ncbi:glycosyltransferase family 2 protein [Flavobacterium agricola]|uniref:Glycosyltransferase family 2 protein n=1 Tax=Flavobacterium agricola TaxID=2870839 RepID=A0ABY6LVT8_9FLAO|nr:glycosyltransferase family 2 protein [Flavobacterium agricola]UYW00341.1 glycosyltransferase family 2 protein [Flavobacterium agricola]
MNNKKPISALLITFNEEQHIERYIRDAEYADEIIIVDSNSTDKTTEIASQFPKVKIFKRAFKNFSDQRNFALQQAQHEWVTFFDADEELTPALQNEIVAKVANPEGIDVFIGYHDFYFKNKKVSFSGQQNVNAPRLFKKSACKYNESLKVHEQLEFVGKSGKLKNKIKHHTFSDDKKYLDKLNGYSYLRAEELYNKKLKPTFYHFYIKPAYRFINYYLIRLGILDGKEGYTIAKLHAISIQNRYKYLNELYAKNKAID